MKIIHSCAKIWLTYVVTLRQLENFYSMNETPLLGIPSGFSQIDKVTLGWRNSDLVVIASHLTMGKTALVYNMIKNISIDGIEGINGTERIPCALFSVNESKNQFAYRLAAIIEKIEVDDWFPWNSEKSHIKLYKTVEKIADAPIFVDDTRALSISELRVKASRLVAEQGVRIIFIDDLQLMSVGGTKFSSPEEQFAYMVESLKNLAEDLNIPIVVLGLLKLYWKPLENVCPIDAYRPQLTHLGHLCEIENVADVLILLYRPEYYKIYEHEGRDLHGLSKLIITKCHGARNIDVDMHFQKCPLKIKNISCKRL